jgi:hypothetical protein
MKIGINLVGVSYNDGTIGRYRNFEDALDGFMKNIVNPLKEEGHEVYFYLFSYDSDKKNEILYLLIPTIILTSIPTFYHSKINNIKTHRK